MGSILIIAICALAGGFYAGSESGAYRLNRIRLRHEAKSGSRLARMLQGVVGDMERFVCVTLVATNLAHYVATFVCAKALGEFFAEGWRTEVYSTLMLAPVLLIVSEVLPKTVFQSRPMSLLRVSAPLLWISDKIFWPIVQVLHLVTILWRRLLGGNRPSAQPAVTSQYLRFFLSEGTEEGVITRQQDLMVRNIMELGSRPLRSMMMPLSHVRMISVEDTPNAARGIISHYRHARIPVYEGVRRNVVGILIVLDFLCNDSDKPVTELMVEPVKLVSELPLDTAFRTLQEAGSNMGIIVDARGRAVGMVTMAGLLQEIFGSMQAA